MSTQPLDYQTYSSILDQADALVRKTGKGLTQVDALHALMHAHPGDSRYAAAARACGRQTAPARAVVTTVVPVRKADVATPIYEEIRLQGQALFHTGQAGSVWEGMGQYASEHPDVFQAYVEECRRVNGQPDARLAKAMAALTPSRSATDTLMQAITTRQAEAPGLSVVAALDAVQKQAPELYTAYVLEHRYHPDARTRPVEKAAPPSVEAIIAKAQAQAAAEGTTTAAVLEKLATAHPETHWEAYRHWHGSPEALREHYVRDKV